jgi:hypothetical protein
MRRRQHFIACLLGLACLGLTGYVIFLSRQNREIELSIQQQQAEVNRGAISQQIGRSLIRDMAAVSMKNSRIKELLVLNGFSVNEGSGPDETRKP